MLIFLVGFLSFISLPSSFAGNENPLTSAFQDKQQFDFVEGVKEFFGFGTQPSKWEDIRSWKPIGTRFAAAYDGNGALLAIYDLSYPELLRPITLGKIGDASVTSQAMLSVFNQAESKMDSLGLSDATQSAIGALGDITQTVMDAGRLPTDWWKSVPWNPSVYPDGSPNSEPTHFQLTDLDLNQLQVGTGFVQGLRQLFQIVLDDSGYLSFVSDSDILNTFEFVRSDDGGYEMRWHDPRSVDVVSHPRKLADFVNSRSGLNDNLRVDAIIASLYEGASAIPVPVVDALVSTVVSRVGRYYKMTLVEHLEMLHEAAIATDEGSIQNGLLSQLSPADHETLIAAFEQTRVTSADNWDRFFSNPDDVWQTDAQNDSDCAAKAKQWLTTQEQTVTDLNSRFSFGVDQKKNRFLYSNSDVCATDDKGPTLSINYTSPQSIAKERLYMELVGVGIEFGSNLVPSAGFTVHEAYDFLVQHARDNTQYWEARLMQHLESRIQPANWEAEYSILQNQRMNPFEMSHDEMTTLISNRRQALGF